MLQPSRRRCRRVQAAAAARAAVPSLGQQALPVVALVLQGVPRLSIDRSVASALAAAALAKAVEPICLLGGRVARLARCGALPFRLQLELQAATAAVFCSRCRRPLLLLLLHLAPVQQAVALRCSRTHLSLAAQGRPKRRRRLHRAGLASDRFLVQLPGPPRLLLLPLPQLHAH